MKSLGLETALSTQCVELSVGNISIIVDSNEKALIHRYRYSKHEGYEPKPIPSSPNKNHQTGSEMAIENMARMLNRLRKFLPDRWALLQRTEPLFGPAIQISMVYVMTRSENLIKIQPLHQVLLSSRF